MNSTEAVRLLMHAAAFDNRQPSEAAAQAWAASLRDVPADDDAFAAIARYYGTPPTRPGERLWILPADLRSHRQAIRNERLHGFQYQPQPGDDDPRTYLANYRAQREAVAAGQQPAAPDTRQLAGNPHPTVARALADVGRPVPTKDEPEQPQRRGPLGVRCPTCTAPIGRPCRTPGTTCGRGRERPPHSARTRAARGLPPPDPDATRAEEQRRRAASRRLAHTAPKTPEEQP